MLEAFRSSQHPITTMSSNDNSLTRENNGSNNLKKLNAFYICKIEGNPKFGCVIFHILMVPPFTTHSFRLEDAGLFSRFGVQPFMAYCI